jgi:hypothetical protein
MNQHVQVIKEKEMVARMSIISLHSSNQKHPFMDQMESIFIYLQSMNSISFKLSVLLTRIHPSFRMDKPYYNPQIAYQHRFSVFLQQQLPTPLPYKEYHRVFNQLLTCPMKVLVQSCLESIETAKNAIELLKKRNPELKKVLMS